MFLGWKELKLSYPPEERTRWCYISSLYLHCRLHSYGGGTTWIGHQSITSLKHGGVQTHSHLKAISSFQFTELAITCRKEPERPSEHRHANRESDWDVGHSCCANHERPRRQSKDTRKDRSYNHSMPVEGANGGDSLVIKTLREDREGGGKFILKIVAGRVMTSTKQKARFTHWPCNARRDYGHAAPSEVEKTNVCLRGRAESGANEPEPLHLQPCETSFFPTLHLKYTGARMRLDWADTFNFVPTLRKKGLGRIRTGNILAVIHCATP